MPVLWINYFPAGSDGKIRADVTDFRDIPLSEITAVKTAADPAARVQTILTVRHADNAKPVDYHVPNTLDQLTADCTAQRAVIREYLEALAGNRTPPSLIPEPREASSQAALTGPKKPKTPAPGRAGLWRHKPG